MSHSQKSFTVFQKTEISEPALFSPSDATKKIDNFPEICVSTFSENIIQKFSSLDTTEKIAELYTANGMIPVYKIRYRGRDIAFYLSRVGAPACVAGFEEIIAMGAKKFVLFGSCGVLDDSIVRDNIMIPVSAVRDEGTSYHYIAPSPEIEADPHSVQILERVLSACGYPYVKGKTWTSDAIYRETLPLIQERRREGCIVVEMECASMLAVAKYRHIPFIQFLYSADNLSSDKWDMRDLSLYGLTSAEKYMVLAFKCSLAL
ncbi:UNVERIFIED_ORG: phosphorylase [Lacrimispora saccharolytica]